MGEPHVQQLSTRLGYLQCMHSGLLGSSCSAAAVRCTHDVPVGWIDALLVAKHGNRDQLLLERYSLQHLLEGSTCMDKGQQLQACTLPALACALTGPVVSHPSLADAQAAVATVLTSTTQARGQQRVEQQQLQQHSLHAPSP